MFEGWLIVTIALGYVSLLFALAWVGDRWMRSSRDSRGRPIIYSLSLAVYCTSWTFFGSVGLATATGYDFLPIYIGPMLMFAIGWPMLVRIMRLAKSQNITSIADFIASRYGKSQAVAALVTLVCVVGSLPYIALQLKAVSVSIETVLGGSRLVAIELPRIGPADTAFVITVALAAFAALFGTRHADATEHQHGLMLAIAAESVVKLMAFLAVGVFVVLHVEGGVEGLMTRAAASPSVMSVFDRSINGGTFLTLTLLSCVCALLLPRQFHVTVVECRSEREIQRAAWLFPLYLVLINIFVIPIAAAGMILLPKALADPDFYVLTLPMALGSETITLISFLGGLSAATAMVIVETVALAIMVCNGVVLPLLLRQQMSLTVPDEDDMARLLLTVRRVAIFVILLLGYMVYLLLGKSQQLAAIGLISFVAIAQLGPAFFIGLVWRKATARGAMAGLLAGFATWAYTLLVPLAAKGGLISDSIVAAGPFGLSILKPQALLFMSFDPITHGAIMSLAINMATFVAVSLLRAPEPVERVQAALFIEDDAARGSQMPSFRLWRTSITVGMLQATVARYLGTERAARSFQDYQSTTARRMDASAEADIHVIRFTERLLASAIGAASSRLVLSLLLRRGNVGSQSALRLLDDASEALQYNRDLLQSALDQVRHGLSVYDREMRLICWNRQFRELLNLPPDLGRVGAPLDEMLRVCAARGDFGPGGVEALVRNRMGRFTTQEAFQERILGGARIIEIRTSPMPQGGLVATYSDITDRVDAANALARANESLERRVTERTVELLEVNAALAEAKSKADAANLDKTRFLAAASHDILQPLNAARLYTTSLVERPLAGSDMQLARNVDASLNAVEEIFSTLIDISRMDAGRLEPEISEFPLQELFDQLKVEFGPVAEAKGLDFRIAPTTVWIRSDRRLFRRLLQNLVSNAIKYTQKGRVLLGVRRRGQQIVAQVLDTGPGIPKEKHALVFKEFQRLEDVPSNTRGLGLGLSIVERIGRVLEHRVSLESQLDHGSVFSVTVPRAPARAEETKPVTVTAGSLTGMCVIAIDNEPAVLIGMEALLTGWGCHVVTATGPADALTRVSLLPGPPEAILADYHLDDTTGVEAVQALRQALGEPVPAIIITADHSPEVQRNVKGLGLGLLRKPVKAAALRAALNQFARRRSAAAAE